MTSNISFILFTYNDAYRLEYIIRNLKPFGEVIISDQESTDNSQAIAEKLGAKFTTRKATGQQFIERQELLDTVTALASHDWIYWGYVDNFLPKPLCEKLVEISLQDKIKYVYLPVHTYLWGDTEHVIAKAEYPCFFKKGTVDFTNNRIHGMGKFLGKAYETLHLPQNKAMAMRHFSLYDLNKFIPAHLRYANTEAEQKFKDGKRLSLVYLLGSMGRYFYLFYLKGGMRAGIRGLMVGFLYASFRVMLSMRLYELEHGLNLETIEAEYAKAKIELVKEIESANF
jgi:glycosyltransferase involved in cell wall biosynthesis